MEECSFHSTATVEHRSTKPSHRLLFLVLQERVPLFDSFSLILVSLSERVIDNRAYFARCLVTIRCIRACQVLREVQHVGRAGWLSLLLLLHVVVAKVILIYSVKFSIMPMKGSSLPVCLCTTTGNPCSKENGVGTHQPEAGTQHELSTRIQRSNEMVLPSPRIPSRALSPWQSFWSLYHGTLFYRYLQEERSRVCNAYLSTGANQVSILPKNAFFF